MTKDSALVPYQTPYLALQADNEVAQILAENLGDVKMSLNDLPRVKVPSGGALYWTIQRGEDDSDPVKDLIGTVLDHHGHRVYYDAPFGEGDKRPPDCSSDDGITGQSLRYEDGTPKLWLESGGCQSCDTCPFAKWGSKGRNAIACSARREVVFLPQNEPFPYIVDLGPTSARVFENFLKSLALQGKRLANAEVSFKLEKKASGSGIDYSLLVCRLVRVLEPIESTGLREYGSAYKRVKALPAAVAA